VSAVQHLGKENCSGMSEYFVEDAGTDRGKGSVGASSQGRQLSTLDGGGTYFGIADAWLGSSSVCLCLRPDLRCFTSYTSGEGVPYCQCVPMWVGGSRWAFSWMDDGIS